MVKRIRGKKLGETDKVYRIASFGCGVDSVAGLLQFGTDKYDEIIFADTGAEKVETYDYLAFLMIQLRWNITIVNSQYGDIYNYYKKKKVYPSRFARDCTGKFKLDPFYKYLRKTYGYDAHFIVDLFIDAAEEDRVGKPKYNYYSLNYPLVNAGITREDCKRIIKEHNMPLPIKSGCFFCPFTPPKVWQQMENSPLGSYAQQYLELSLELEKEADPRWKKAYPLVRLKGKDMQTLECACYSPRIDPEEATKAFEKEVKQVLTVEHSVDYEKVKRSGL